MRRFELSEGSSDKFWQVSREGTTLRVQFGRIGSTGQIKLKTCSSEAAAEAEMAKLVAEKTKKGYREVSASPPPPPPPSPSPSPPPSPSPSDLLAPRIHWTPEALAKREELHLVQAPPPRDRRALMSRIQHACKAHANAIALGEEKADDAGKRVVAALRATYAEGVEPKTLDPDLEAGIAVLLHDYEPTLSLLWYWTVREGLVFAVDTLAAMPTYWREIEWNVSKLHPTYVRRGNPDLNWDAWPFGSVRGMAACVAEATAVDRKRAHEHASAIRARSKPPTRTMLARAFDDEAWINDDARVILAMADIPPGARGLGALLRDVDLAIAWEKRTTEPAHALVDRLGLRAVDVLAPRVENEYRRDDALDGLVLMESLDSAKAMVTVLDKRTAAPKIRAFFDRRPDLAIAALAPIVAGRHKLAVYAEPLLKGYLRAHPSLATALTPMLDARSQSLLARLAADTAAPDAIATDDALPEVLRNPPWKNPAPKRAPPTLALTPLPFDSRVHWNGDEQKRALDWGDTLLAQYRQYSPAGSEPMPAAARSPAMDAWGKERIEKGHTWNVTGLIHAMSDDAIWSLVEGGTPLGDVGATYLLARFGARALSYLEVTLGDDSELLTKQFDNVEAPSLATRFASALAKRRFYDAALKWLNAFPEAAALGLVPSALGKAKKERSLAQSALRAIAQRHRAIVEDVASRYGDAARAAVIALLDAPPDEFPDKLPELPAFVDEAALPPARLVGSRTALPTGAIRTLLTMLQLSPLERPLAILADVKEACEARSLAELAWAIFQAWLSSGADSKQNWAFAALGHLGDDDTARKLTPLIRAWPGESQHARAVMGLDVLAAIGSDVALMHLHGIAQKIKFKGLQEKAREKMQFLADARGLSAAELADRLVPDLGLDDTGTLVLDFGPRSFRVGFDPHLVPVVLDASGKRLVDLPKPGKSDDAEKAAAAALTWKTLKKDAKAVSATQVLRLELLMCDARRIPAASFRLFFVEHPLLIHVVRRVVWGVWDGSKLVHTFRVAEDRSLADMNDDVFTLADDAMVGLVHRLELDDDTTARWSQVLSDYEILQPFDQLGRRIFAPTDAEKTANALKRLEGETVKTGKVLALENRGWRKGAPQDAGWVWDVHKPLPGGIVAELPIEGGIAIGYMSETPPEQKLGVVTLRRQDEWQASTTLTFGSLPPAVFSELVRDLESLRE